MSIKENDHITLANFIHDPLADHKMDKFVIRPPQKRPSPTDSPTAADSNDPGILDPGEGAPTNSGRSASNTGNTKCRKYQDSYLNYGFISFSRNVYHFRFGPTLTHFYLFPNKCFLFQ